VGIHSLREDKAAREREDKALRELTDRLVADYTDTHAEQDVHTAIGTARSRFDGHKVRDFIPILVERIARRMLDGTPGERAEKRAESAGVHTEPTDTTAEHADATAEQTETTGGHTDTSGEETETTSEQTEITGEQVYATGEHTDTTNEQTDVTGEPADTSGEHTATTGEHADITSGHPKTTGGHADTTDEHVETATGHTETTGGQTKATVLHTDTPTGQTRTTGEHTETSAEQAKTAGQHADTTGGRTEITGGHTEITTKHAETSDEHPEIIGERAGTTTEYAETFAGHIETTSEHTETNTGQTKTAGLHTDTTSGRTEATGEDTGTTGEHTETSSGGHSDTTGGIPVSASAAEPASPGIADRLRSAAIDFLPPPWSGRNLVGPVAAAIVVVIVVALAFGTGSGSHRTVTATGPSVTTVRGVVGSEKLAYFNDPKVIAALARHGLRVQVEGAGSRQEATLDLSKYDFAFPSSTPAAERILRERNITTRYTPFSSPMAIATFKPIVDLLTAAGVVHPGPVPTFDMNAYLNLVNSGTQWNQLPGNTTYQVPKNILVSTTDPRSSNSAAMYLAIASYVANDDTIVRGSTAEANAVQKVSKLFVGQGYSDYSSKGPFDEYLSGGMGPSPMVLIYEAQYVEASVEGRITPDMELMYPSPTILSQHTLVPLNSKGDRLGKLLTTDPDLQQLAAEHGFRTGDPSQFTSVTNQYHVPVEPQLVDVVDTPAYDTLQHLLDGVARAYN
jgi:hypothetical protein